MFSGAQISLYPLTDGHIQVVTDALGALDPYQHRLRIETDDLSTLLIGPPATLFDAMGDLFVAACRGTSRCVLSATVSRGYPGEPADPARGPNRLVHLTAPIERRIELAVERLAGAPRKNQPVAAQFSLYPLEGVLPLAEIDGCIAFLKRSGQFDRSKPLCTKLRGDAGPVIAAIRESFLCFGAPGGHVALDMTVAAGKLAAAGTEAEGRPD